MALLGQELCWGVVLVAWGLCSPTVQENTAETCAHSVVFEGIRMYWAFFGEERECVNVCESLARRRCCPILWGSSAHGGF